MKIKNVKWKIAQMFFLGAFMATIHAQTNSNTVGEVRFIQKLEQGEKVKIAALGTSLTGTWFNVMKSWLNETYADQGTFYDLGVGGSASSYPSGKSGLDQVKIAASYRPDVVFIEFAINDSYIPYTISVKESRYNLESIIATLLRSDPEVEIVLQTMNVVIDMPELDLAHATKRMQLTKYLKMYRKVARKKGLVLIDHYPNWKRYLKKEGRDAYIKIVPDGLHPSAEGYNKILIPELQKVIQ